MLRTSWSFPLANTRASVSRPEGCPLEERPTENVSVSAHLAPQPSGRVARRSVHESMISCGTDDLSDIEGRPCAPDRGDIITAFAQPQSLIVEAGTVGGFEWCAFEKAVVLVHLRVHLCEDGQTPLAPHIAILGSQDPYGLGCADQGPSQHSEM